MSSELNPNWNIPLDVTSLGWVFSAMRFAIENLSSI